MTNTGQALEDEVHAAIGMLLEEGALPYRPELARWRRRARYFSPDRQAEIAFENVLELHAVGAAAEARPVQLVIFECKDHARPVEVRHVDELVGRLAAIDLAAKAYLVTRHAFTRTAMATARRNGIGLVRMLPQGQADFVLYQMTPDEYWRHFAAEARRALAEEAYRSLDGDLFAVDGERACNSFEMLLGG